MEKKGKRVKARYRSGGIERKPIEFIVLEGEAPEEIFKEHWPQYTLIEIIDANYNKKEKAGWQLFMQ